MNKLGSIKKINDLRSVWAHEEYDFSKWLAEEENLALLSDAVGIEIVLEELESAVGGFSVDLYASEEGTGRKIIVENQLEDTNHDHLGKIITYASGKEASVIIWIVKRARDEHLGMKGLMMDPVIELHLRLLLREPAGFHRPAQNIIQIPTVVI